jgi:hypothetical protein
LQRLKARQIQASASKTEEDIAFAESLLSENFLFSQVRFFARTILLIGYPYVAGVADGAFVRAHNPAH